VSRVGVFICHCGENIARTVDCEAVAEALKDHPGVAFTKDYKYMCSDPGQQLVKKAIEDNDLTGVVVAACSPHMHEKTFRRACDQAGLNKYMCEMANIREHCSWIHEDRGEATEKAIDITRTIVEKVKHNKPLESIRIPVTKRALVIGGGIAGIQAALDIADGGHQVVLIEKEASIGGHMSQLSETFPTLDCSQCILTPRMVEAYQHPNITLHTWSEVEKVDGYIGNFEVTIRKKARSRPARRNASPASSRPGSASARRSTCLSRRQCPTSRCSTARTARCSRAAARASPRTPVASARRRASRARSTTTPRTRS
jgi:heterodisulfide reductase subunit A